MLKRFVLIAIECDEEATMLMSPFQIAHLGVMRMQHNLSGAACEDVTRGVEALSTAQIGVMDD